LMYRRPPSSTTVPYTTLFRSRWRDVHFSIACTEPFRRLRYCYRIQRLQVSLHPVIKILLMRWRVIYWYDRHRNEHYYHDNERREDRKSTRLNSSHVKISYAVF